jgi:putative membrane protein
MIEKDNFSEPQHQSLLGVVVYLLRNGRTIVSLIILALAFGNDKPYLFIALVTGLIVLALAILYISYLQYKNFTFHVQGEELIIHKGVFVKDRKTIPLSRIQSVQIEQNILQQALGVVGLKIDSAGSSTKELEIPALKAEVAESFRQLLKSQKPAANVEVLDPLVSQTEEKKELVTLSPKDLLKVGLTENHIRNGLVAILVVYGYASQYMNYLQDYIDEYVGEYFTEVPAQLIRASLVFILATILTFIIVSVVISLARTVLKFYDFRASIQGDVVEIKSGLLKKNEYRIPVNKIQYLKWESNPLRKLLGFSTVKVYQVESSKQERKGRVEIPACYPLQSQALEELIYQHTLPQLHKEDQTVHPDTLSYTRFYSMVLGIPLITIAITLFFLLPDVWYFPLVMLPVIPFLAHQYGKSIRLEFHKDVLVIYKGWIFPSRTVISYFKAQAVRSSDNLFLRKNALSHLTIHSASGSIRVRYLDHSQVIEATNYILYKVENYKGQWI